MTMRLLHPAARSALMLAAVCAGRLPAQQAIGRVPVEGAQVGGLVTVSGGIATIQNNGSVTAGRSAARVTLSRGGWVSICSMSTVQMSQSTTASAGDTPLLVALERGAAEMRWRAQARDAIITPDLRLELSGAAPLDLRIRVVSNGDTCIDNAGKDAPEIHVTEQFGVGGYLIKPGQRVLFEHGSTREVVDKESSGCGCPAVPAPATLQAGKTAKAAEPNAFPEAVSAGLETPSVPAAKPGETHAQVSATISYNGAAPESPSTAPPVPAQPAVAPLPPPKPEGRQPLHALGRFFRRIFGGGAS